jgi:hypothetical protein
MLARALTIAALLAAAVAVVAAVDRLGSASPAGLAAAVALPLGAMVVAERLGRAGRTP